MRILKDRETICVSICVALIFSCTENRTKVSIFNVSKQQNEKLTQLTTRRNICLDDSTTIQYSVISKSPPNNPIVVSFVKGADTLLNDTLPNQNCVGNVYIDTYNDTVFMCWKSDSCVHFTNLNQRDSARICLRVLNWKKGVVILNKEFSASNYMEVTDIKYNPFTKSVLIATQKANCNAIVFLNMNKKDFEWFAYDIASSYEADNCSLALLRYKASVFAFYTKGDYFNFTKRLQKLYINKIGANNTCSPYCWISDMCEGISDKLILMDDEVFCQERFTRGVNKPDTFIFKRLAMPSNSL